MTAERTTTISLGDAQVEVRFDFQAAEAMTRTYPGCDAEVTINTVCVNGEWIDSSLFDKHWLKTSEAELVGQVLEEAAEAEAEAAEREADARRDDFRSYYP